MESPKQRRFEAYQDRPANEETKSDEYGNLESEAKSIWMFVMPDEKDPRLACRGIIEQTAPELRERSKSNPLWYRSMNWQGETRSISLQSAYLWYTCCAPTIANVQVGFAVARGIRLL